MFTENWNHTINIKYDNEFWSTKMVKQLSL